MHYRNSSRSVAEAGLIFLARMRRLFTPPLGSANAAVFLVTEAGPIIRF
jgi:hypothetical protein